MLLLPAGLHHLGLQLGQSLKGWQSIEEVNDLSWKNWSTGTWQEDCEVWLKRRMKSRHFFIRLNNQLKYSLFNQTNAKDIIEGKNVYYF